jgi:Zn-dependent M28 family amino/carboxypeptidase
MRNCYTRLCLMALLSCKISICSAQSVNIDSVITPSSLKALVQTLAADSFQGRLTGTKMAADAAALISEAFQKAGAMPIAGNDGYLMPFDVPLSARFNFAQPYKLKSFNVVAALAGKSKAKELVIFSAHYDHIGTLSHTLQHKMPENGNPEDGDEIYNGANDNASGISALIHLAKYFAKYPQRERTILFIAFSGEEEGLLGSKVLAEAFNPKVVTAMVNMDMIGRPRNGKDQHPFITGFNQSNLAKVMNKQLHNRASRYGKKYFGPDPFPEDNLYQRSDNFPFAMKGMVAHTIMASAPNDQYYHSLNDEWEKLDYDYLAEVVKAIALATTGLADGSDNPKSN